LRIKYSKNSLISFHQKKNSFKKGKFSVGTCEEISPWPTGLAVVEQTSCQGHVLAH
jgi:hypothetical protein